MMRRDFCRNGQPLCLGCAYELDRPSSRDVSEMEPATRAASQLDVQYLDDLIGQVMAIDAIVKKALR